MKMLFTTILQVDFISGTLRVSFNKQLRTPAPLLDDTRCDYLLFFIIDKTAQKKKIVFHSTSIRR